MTENGVELDEYTRLIIQMDLERSQSVHMLQSELDRLYMIQKLSGLVNATFNLEQILRAILSSAVKDLEFDTGLVYLNIQDSLQLRFWHGIEEETREHMGERIADLIRRRHAEHDSPWLLSQGDPFLPSDIPPLLKEFGLFWLVAVPVVMSQEMVAGLAVGRRSMAPPVTAHDIQYLTLLESQAAISVVNSRLYRKIENHNRTLERQVRERTSELMGAYRDLQTSKDQLHNSEKMAFLGQLTAGIAHEMNTPIGAVANSLKTLKDLATELENSIGHPDVTDDDFREIVKEVQASLNIADSALSKAAGFVRSLKTQTRDLANMEVRNFNPMNTVRDLATLLGHELKKSRCTLETQCEENLSLQGDAGKFSQILTNLINNAMDAYDGRGGGPIFVRLRGDGSDIVLEVEDKASGISKENLQKLFKQVFTTKWQGKGTGLGLSIVHGIVTGAFKGTINVESEEGVGTKFTVRLPAAVPASV